MNNAVKEALKKLFGGDEQALEDFVTSIDSTNRSITERNLVRRDAEQTEAVADADVVADAAAEQTEGATSENEDPNAAPAAAAAAEPATSEQEDEQDGEQDDSHTVANVELDDEAVNAIVAALLENEGFTTTIAAALTPVLAEMRSLADRMEQYQAAQADATRRSADHDARLAALEADEDSKQRTWTADISRKTARTINVTHRPRTPENTETTRPLSSSERANETLRKIGAA